MNWSMPRPVLQAVAGVIGVAALGSFTLAVLSADGPARLPGDRPGEAGGAAIVATEAMPLAQERIEGPPPPPELTEEEKAKLEAEKQAREAAARAKAEAEKAAMANPEGTPTLVLPQDRIGEALEKSTAQPSPEDPPF